MAANHRIGAELNAGGRESLFLYAGANRGWLGGACISYRAAGKRRAAINDPRQAYELMMGLDDGELDWLLARNRSVNDLVREQMRTLMAHPRLSKADLRRLQVHMDSMRELSPADLDALIARLGVDERAGKIPLAQL